MIDASFISKEDYIRGEMFPQLASDQIFYSKIDYAPYFLQNVARKIPHPFVLITHNGDLPVTDYLLDYAKTIPNLKKWYGQNIECREDPLIQSLPIGLENKYNFPELKKMDRLYDVVQLSKGKIPNRLLYLNFSFSTRKEERESAWKKVKSSCTSFTDKCQQSVSQTEYSSWMNDVVDHHYILCPRGNGIDTHRMWETLYLGRIPVVKRNTNTRYFEDLPILLVDSYEDVTDELLESKIPHFCEISNFNIEKLKFSYWKKIIDLKVTPNQTQINSNENSFE